MLKKIIQLGGSAMLINELAGKIRQTNKNREKSLRRKKAGFLGLGVVLGATAGVFAGILYAPRAGKDTREALSRRGGEVWGKIKARASATGHKVANAVEEKYYRVHSAPNQSVDEILEPTEKFEGDVIKDRI